MPLGNFLLFKRGTSPDVSQLFTFCRIALLLTTSWHQLLEFPGNALKLQPAGTRNLVIKIPRGLIVWVFFLLMSKEKRKLK